jgi:hypothetical protein
MRRWERWVQSIGRAERWPWAVVGISLLAFATRLVIIAASHGGNDLRIYVYFSRLPFHGLNPFAAPAGGLFPPSQSDQPALEIAIFNGLLRLHDSATTLRILFALADVGVLLLIGLWCRRPRGWRLAFMLFYAFNPFVLLGWTAYAEDKTLLFLGIAALLVALERGREWTAWLSAAAVTAFKIVGVFVGPVLALHSYRARRWKVLGPVAVLLAGLVFSSLPWFPKSLDVFSRRATRLSIDPPIHASPTLLLARLHLYSPAEAKILTAAALLAVTGLFAWRRLGIRQAVVWALFAGYIFLPDDPFNRLLLISLPFVFVVEMSRWRWIALWVLSCVDALAADVATRGVPHALSAIASPLRTLFAHEATVRHVLWMSLLPALLIAFYALDSVSARRRTGPRGHAWNTPRTPPSSEFAGLPAAPRSGR